jgi:hypothetical protein
MKTNLNLLNSLGFNNPAQKALYAAYILQTATLSSPAIAISPAVAVIPAKPAIIAQTAKPARALTPLVTAAQNTTGYRFGELYLNSPAYPAGTAIPAIGPKPPSNAVLGAPAIPAIPAVAAISSPKIDALKGWEDAIEIVKSTSVIEIIAYLPILTGAKIYGLNLSGIDLIAEITLSTLTADKWLDEKASNTQTVITNEVATMEKYLYKQALVLAADNKCSITNAIRSVNGVSVACKKMIFTFPAFDYDVNSEALQLGKLG